MAKQKSLVIVESPAKARTIGKFLGGDFDVQASIGHVRDLPVGKKDLPEKFKNEDWAHLGVNVDNGFEPVYIVPPTKKKQVTKLKEALKDAKDLYLATDEDREGEAISWHLCELLKPKVPVHRLVFHEITKEAIDKALSSPRTIDDGLVRAQETRRILDRLYGFDVSNLLWRKVRPQLSAGRVQSVAVRLIVERERERRSFVAATYWDLMGTFAAEGDAFEAKLMSVDGRKLPVGKDFDPDTGKIKNEDLLLLDEAGAAALVERLQQASFKVSKLEDKPYTRSPAPPFTTSTMQQEANRKLGFTAKRTMSAAQSLYENGHITYMRTDSTSLAQEAVNAARDLVKTEYGEEFLPAQPRTYASKVKNAQEAHEAIRPAGQPFTLPSALEGKLSSDEYKLFELIWKRTIASQMENARGRRITITIEGDGALFQVSGKTIEFPGFLRAYVEGADDPKAELADQETLLPAVQEQQGLACQKLDPNSHTTQPPARFTEASLTKRLEERGIGRPSTYAAIIEKIQQEYVFKKGNALVPTWVAFVVCRLLEEHLPTLIDYEFTAQMEDFLDSISRQEAEHVEYLNQFYFGNGKPGLKSQLTTKLEEIDARSTNRFSLGKPELGENQHEVVLRVGKWGPFVQQGEDDDPEKRTASLPADLCPDELTLEFAVDLLDKGQIADEPIGTDPESGREVFIKIGRFGPYVQLAATDDEKAKNVSLLKGMEQEDVNIDVALKLLSLPRELGTHENGEAVVAHTGRFGPYIKCGSETRSLPADSSPITVTMQEALALLAQPKTRGRAAPKEPLKVFEASPVTEQPVKLLDGRYGPYVTDGETNCSLPKGTTVEDITFERALQMLTEKAATSPRKKKKKAKKKAAKKKTAKKKTAKKKTAKKTAKKKATKKKE